MHQISLDSYLVYIFAIGYPSISVFHGVSDRLVFDTLRLCNSLRLGLFQVLQTLICLDLAFYLTLLFVIRLLDRVDGADICILEDEA